MMDFKKETAKVLLESGEKIAQMIAQESFDLWKRKDFRMFIDFDHQTQTEQDRIFNELEVSLIGLYVLHFDDAIENATDQAKLLVFKGLREGIQTGFLKVLGDTGVEVKYLKDWEKLVNLRLKEYRDDYKIAMKMSAKDKSFDKKDADLRPAWARAETLKIDCLSHIRRGNFDEKDPLWKFLTKWFITMDARLNPLMAA